MINDIIIRFGDKLGAHLCWFLAERITTKPVSTAKIIKKGHVTRGNFSCNLQRNDVDSKTLQVAEGMLRSQSTCNAPAGNCFKLFLRRHLEISREQKMRSDWLIFTKIALKVAMGMSRNVAKC